MATLRVFKMRDGAVIPRYKTSGAAGMDLAACLDAPVVISPSESARVPTGLRIALPPGHEGQVRPR
ncbi:MAG: dUTP diphosphatase, partial [Polyangiales bacterium]